MTERGEIVYVDSQATPADNYAESFFSKVQTDARYLRRDVRFTHPVNQLDGVSSVNFRFPGQAAPIINEIQNMAYCMKVGQQQMEKYECLETYFLHIFLGSFGDY